MFKRVFLFLATNMAVLALVSIVMSVLGVNPNQFGGQLVMAVLHAAAHVLGSLACVAVGYALARSILRA